MRRVWSVLTVRGRWLVGTGLVVLLGSMVGGQRDLMRVGLLLLALPLVALVLVLRARRLYLVQRFGWLYLLLAIPAAGAVVGARRDADARPTVVQLLANALTHRRR